LGQIVKAKRAEGHKQAHAALQDHHCTDLLLRLAYWIDVELNSSQGRSQKRNQIAATLATPAAKFAAQVIQDCHRKARKLGKKIRTIDPTKLHRLRILIKKLRYATDFFGSLWPHRRTKKYLSALRDLQQALGTFHDTTVAMNLIASLAADGGADVKVGVERITDWLASEQRCKRKELIALWSKFTKRRLF
jgi:CHAD domain-containing protein